MAVQSLQYSSFLGGEVSPRLQYRTDMDKFGKWFKTAENIRFHTIGSFENRPGFAKVADTKRNITGEVIKLISFSFNDEESFLLEFGQHRSIGDTGYLRVFKNGKPVLVDGVPYEIESPLKIEKESDIKYVQSGDIIFITDGKSPIQELRRLKTDGTEWEIKPFEFYDDCVVLDEENTNKDNYLIQTGSAKTKTEKRFTISFSDYDSYFKLKNMQRINLQFDYYDGSNLNFYHDFENPNITSLQDLANEINKDLILKNAGISASLKTENIIEINQISDKSIEKIISSKKAYFRETYHASRDFSRGYSTQDTPPFPRLPLENVSFYIPAGINVYCSDLGGNWSINIPFSYYLDKRLYNRDEVLSLINEQFKEKTLNRYGVRITTISSRDYLEIYNLETGEKYNPTSSNQFFNYLYYEYFKRDSYGEETYYGVEISSVKTYTVDSVMDFFGNKNVGDIFSVRRTIDSTQYSKKISNTGPTTPFSVEGIISDGSWRMRTSGSWIGKINLYYSKDKGATYNIFYTTDNLDSDSDLNNPNTSGKLDVNETIYLKAEITVSNGTCAFHLYTNSFETNSYYKITNIFNSNQAEVINVKNDINSFPKTYLWREQMFSDKKGYPQSLAFYQNRLFLGKDYQLYGSKTNDFWNFYEPIEISDDDPLNMSLLSYKVNNIKNLVTIRSFFVFTQGGEFGISAEGALTQANKYLKQFSTHGSADCLPIVVGSAVIFVEKSANRVRALQYSFESDNYEAEDISVLMEELLEKETIITTEYLPNTHEILFLAESGIIWVLKFYPEQNIFSWSHWKHAKGKITNICVVPHGSEDDLYIAVDTETGKQIEILNNDIYLDSKHEEEVLGTNKLLTPYINTELYLYDKDNNFIKKENTDDNGYLINNESKLYCWWGGAFKYFFKSLQPKIGDEIYSLDADNNLYKVNGNITNVSDDYLEVSISTEEGFVATVLRGGETYDIDEAYAYFNYGLPYTSTATLLSPEITLQDGNNSVYHKKRPFKVHYVYKNSYGFKIGVEDNEKMEPEWQKVDEVIDNERELTSGKKAILVPARYDGTSRVSFIQDEPYPMIVENINIEVDYGGK